MASILRSAQEIIMPHKEKESEPATTSAPAASGSAAGGLLNLIKKTTGIGASETEGPISPPESKTTSPALAPSDKRFTPAPISTNTSTLKPLSPPLSHPSSPTSPIRSISPPSPTTAPRQFALGGSPARVSASSTQIFERNVQEAHPITSSTGSNGVPVTATKIPAHIATENHIPAVLEASSIAITDGSIDPDHVEIAVMTSHQSLSSQASNSLHPHKDTHADDSSAGTTAVHPPSTSHSQHSSNAFQDKRRLSFISFSDIVQAEQADLLDSTILSPNPSTNVNPGFPAATVIDQVGISGITETLLVRRSPSPRYNASSPPRTSAGLLPGVGKSEQEGVLVETLGQSIRKTGSGDLGKGF